MLLHLDAEEKNLKRYPIFKVLATYDLELCKCAVLPYTTLGEDYKTPWTKGLYYIFGHHNFHQPNVRRVIYEKAVDHLQANIVAHASPKMRLYRSIMDCDCYLSLGIMMQECREGLERMTKYSEENFEKELVLPNLSGLCLSILTRVASFSWATMILPCKLRALENSIREDMKIGRSDLLPNGASVVDKWHLRHVSIREVEEEHFQPLVDLGTGLDYITTRMFIGQPTPGL